MVRSRAGPAALISLDSLISYFVGGCGSYMGRAKWATPTKNENNEGNENNPQCKEVLMAAIKERPLCRKTILNRKLSPFLVNGTWDGRRSVNPEGTRGWLSEGMRRQMRKMILEGVWGPVKIDRNVMSY